MLSIPPIAQLGFRARYGHAQLGPEGIAHVPEPDAMLLLGGWADGRMGAWAQFLTLYRGILRDVALEGGRAAATLGPGNQRIWLTCDVKPIGVQVVTQGEAEQRLDPLRGKTGAVRVEAVGAAHEIALLFDSLTSS